MDYPLSLAGTTADAYLYNGKFTDGTPDGVIPPSRDPAQTMNDVIDSILAVQAAGGLVPEESNVNQLRDGIALMILTGRFSISALDALAGAVGGAAELAALVEGVHKRITVDQLFAGRETVDLYALHPCRDILCRRFRGQLPVFGRRRWRRFRPVDRRQ